MNGLPGEILTTTRRDLSSNNREDNIDNDLTDVAKEELHYNFMRLTLRRHQI